MSALAWSPAAPPRAMLICVHGLSGAAQDFSPLAVSLAATGWVTYAIELRGQGNDPVRARHGDLQELSDWWQDLSAFVTLLRERHPGVPWILAGESMGGVIAFQGVQYLPTRENLRGLLLFAPVVKMAQRPTWSQELIFLGLSRIIPRWRVKLGDFAPKDEINLRVTRDQVYQDYLYTSPHHVDTYTLRFVRHLGEMIMQCHPQQLPENLPVLMAYAQHDVFITPRLIEDFFEELPTTQKAKLFYPTSYHCLLHDLDVAQVVQDLQSWLEVRIS